MTHIYHPSWPPDTIVTPRTDVIVTPRKDGSVVVVGDKAIGIGVALVDAGGRFIENQFGPRKKDIKIQG